MKKKLYKIVSLLLCLAALFSLASCKGGDSVDSTETKDTLNIAISGDNGTLIPSKVMGTFVGIVRQYSEPLLDYTADGERVWCLATGIDGEDTTEWTIHLREGVKFSNGNEFDANDVMFTMQYYMTDPLLASQFSSLDLANSEVIDKYTFKLALSNYTAMLMGSLSQMYMMDEESFDEEDAVMNPIGTGPYVVTDYVINSHVDLKANENYWGEKAKIPNLHYKVLNEQSQIVNALQTKSVDVSAVPAQDLEFVKTLPDYSLESYYTAFTPTVEFNITENSVMNSLDARLAVCHAIDRQAMIDLVYFGNADLLNYPVSMHCYDYTDDLANLNETYSIGYDVELARQYAEKAGLVGKEITVITNGTADYVTEAEMLQLNLKEIGVSVKIVNYDTASYWSVAYDPTMYDIALYAASSPQRYAVGLLYEYVLWGKATKNGWPEYYEYLDLGAKAVANPDPEARKDMLKELSQMFVDAVPWYGICDQMNTVAVNKNLEGVELWNSGIMHYADWSWK